MMADGDRKRELMSTPAKDANKRPRPDLNESVIAAQGMDSLNDDDGCLPLDVADLQNDLEDVIKSAVTKACPEMQNSADRPRRNASGSTKANGKQSTVNNEDIVPNLVKELVPLLISTISAAVAASTRKTVEVLQKEIKSDDTKLLKMQSLVLTNKYECDRLEQYTRRESIRISGIPDEVGNNDDQLVKAVIDIAQAIEVPLDPNEISVVHRVGKPHGGSKQVLCRFVSRNSREKMMRSRKKLKDKPMFGGAKVYLNDDLTMLRAKLFAYVKSLDIVKRANTSNGRIHCTTDTDAHVVIDSPDDLIKLNIKNPDFNRLGLASYFFLNDQH